MEDKELNMQKDLINKKTVSIPLRSTTETLSSKGFHHSATKSRALVLEFTNSLKPVHMPYKPAKLYSAKGDLSKEWYVEYYYLLPARPYNTKDLKKDLI